jgi:putative transposase
MKSWPHSPSRSVTEPGTYFITAATYKKVHHFRSAEKLTLLQSVIFKTCEEFEFKLQAWAIFPNHYHLIGFNPVDKGVLKMTQKIHSVSARELNRLDDAIGRKVWFFMRDKHLTYERSYLARLNYVHNNPTHHGLGSSLNYPFCSAHWFETQGERSFVETVKSFKTDQLEIEDDF